MNTVIHKGDIFFADLGDTVGSEQSGVRPVLVIQNNVGNRFSPTIIVSPITSKIKKGTYPTHVIINPKCGLNETSMILLEQIRTIDKTRLGRYLGTVDDESMRKVDRAISVSLGLFQSEVKP